MTKAEAQTWCEGWVFAYCCDRPLNWWVTIRLTLAYTDTPFESLQRFKKRAIEWVTRQTGQPAFCAYAFENPPTGNGLLAGLHAHLFFHLPAHLRSKFRQMQKRWRAQAGLRFGRGVIKAEHGWHCDHTDQAFYLNDGYLGFMRYCLKGVAPEVAKQFGRRAEDQGLIKWKRIGCTESMRGDRLTNPNIFASADFRERLMLLREKCPALAAYAQPCWS